MYFMCKKGGFWITAQVGFDEEEGGVDQGHQNSHGTLWLHNPAITTNLGCTKKTRRKIMAVQLPSSTGFIAGFLSIKSIQGVSKNFTKSANSNGKRRAIEFQVYV